MRPLITFLIVLAIGIGQSFANERKTAEMPANTFEVTVSKPGNLKSQLLAIDADLIEGLVLKGKINGTDLKYLSGGEGRTATLSYLDMADLEFEYDGTEYHTIVDAPEGGMGTTYFRRYFLSEENMDVETGGSPTSKEISCYRNNLAAAFEQNKTLKHVILPKFISSLGERIFDRCGELTTVKFPDGLTAVGDMAFYYCQELLLSDFPSFLEEIGDSAFAGVKLGDVRLDKKTRLSYGAFQSSSIARLEMPYPSDSIPDLAFAYCHDLKEVSIGEGVKYLGDRAFGYSGIETAHLPSSIQEVSENAFYGCPFVMNIQPEDGIRYIGKVAYELTDNTRSEYTVKAGTVSLAPGLFAFTAASQFSMPESVEIIGKEAFACTNMTSMPELPFLRRIDDRAFRDCQKLARITIPETVEYIGSDVFTGCNALWSVTYNAVCADCPYGVSPRDLEQIVIGDKVRRLPKGLYTGNTNITEVILPQSIEELDHSVFSGCVNLAYVRLSDNITTISDYAFNGCSSLNGIHWPANLSTVGSRAFEKCTSLRTISLPEGVASVGYSAFYGCENAENLYIASTIGEFGDGCFTFRNPSVPTTIAATAETPQGYEWNWHYIGEATIKVPQASLAAYQASPIWNGSRNGKTNLIVPISEIDAPASDSETSFESGISKETDLGDTVIGDVYVTIGEEDGYDETDGSIVLNSSMEEEYMDAVGGMEPGKSDLHNRFDGLVVQVPAGKGTITINCITIGLKHICVKFGNEEPQFYAKDSKGEITIGYDVTEDTFVYIYATETPRKLLSRPETGISSAGNCVKIYAVGISPSSSGISVIAADESLPPIVEYYHINGTRIDNPTAPGIYIGRRSDGSAAKVMIE